jgi:hypothetical protein
MTAVQSRFCEFGAERLLFGVDVLTLLSGGVGSIDDLLSAAGATAAFVFSGREAKALDEQPIHLAYRDARAGAQLDRPDQARSAPSTEGRSADAEPAAGRLNRQQCFVAIGCHTPQNALCRSQKLVT